MIVHREQNVKREDQQVATIRCLLLTSVSTCFGHHYAHLQENKDPVMTVQREQNVKREDQQVATIRCLLLTSVST